MSQVDRIDKLMGRLRERLARGEMDYEEAVAAEELVLILAAVRLRMLDDISKGRSVPQLVSLSALDAILRGNTN